MECPSIQARKIHPLKLRRSKIPKSSTREWRICLVLARLGARDIRSNLGTNLIHVREEMGLEPWCYGGKRVTDELREHNRARVPEVDEWRVPLLHKLLAERQACFYLGYDDLDTYNELTHSLVTN